MENNPPHLSRATPPPRLAGEDDDAYLRRLTGEARARAGEGPLREPAAIAAAVSSLTCERIDNPKIHAADLRRAGDRQPDVAGFLGRVRALTAGRQKGDPQTGTIRQIAQMIGWLAREQRGPWARASYETLARRTGYCAETVRRVVRWLQARDAVGVLNVLRRGVARDGYRRLLRDANAYLLPLLEAPAAPADTGPGWALRAAQRSLALWSAALGLAPRGNALPRGSG